MIQSRIALSVLAILVVIAVAGCGSSSSGSGDGGSAGPSPADLAAPGSLVYVEGDLRPSGELESNVNALATKVAGIENLGDFVVSELEGSAEDGAGQVDFATEIDPWLGETAGVAFSRLVDGELSEPLIAIETTNAKATQQFIDKQSKGDESSSYEGIDFTIGGSESNAVGLIGDWFVIADGEKDFKAAVDASEGDSLGGEDRFQSAISAASNGSLADLYVDVGGLLKQSKGETNQQAQEVLQGSGIDASDATAVASVIPGADQIEVELSSNLGGEKAPSGDVSELLGSMPAGAMAAFAVSGFGEQLQEALDELDANGIPGSVPPNELKSTLSEGGIDIDKIAGSLEDAALFAEGISRNTLGGAMVVTASNSEAADAIAALGTLLRGARVPGVTVLSGNASGFSLSGPELGRKPIVFAANGSRVAIGYGVAQTLKGLSGSGATLSDGATYKEAVASLGKTPISAFVDGPAALRLAESLVPRSETGFWESTRYLKWIAFLALGSGTSDGDDLATARLIAGLKK
jgi:hypothetical protein